MPTLTVVSPSGRFHREAHEVRRFLFRALSRISRKDTVEVYLLTAAEMRHVNRTACGKNAPTTVLSFPASPAFPTPGARSGVRCRGEIFLAPAVIRRSGGLLFDFALHGLLHLFGYTHDGKRDTIRMERKEKWLMKRVMGKEQRHHRITNLLRIYE